MKTEQHTMMLEHIAQEAEIITALLDDRKNVTRKFCELFLQNNIKKVYFSGSGSPANACEVLRYFCEKLLSIETSYSIPTVFNQHLDFNLRDYIPGEIALMCPAESGRTKGTVITARHAKELGIHTVCTSIFPEGILAGICDVVLFKPSGQEIALPSTKGHSTGILLFLLCFLEAALSIGKLNEKDYDNSIAALYRLASNIEDIMLKTGSWFKEYQDELMDSGKYWFIAYGANVGTAKECALKFLECTMRPSFGYEMEEFMHGPLAALKSTDTVFFLLAEDGPEKERLRKLAGFCRGVTHRCVSIQSIHDEIIGDMTLSLMLIGNEMTSVLELLVPVQVLAYYISDCLGHDLTQHSKHSASKTMELSFLE